MTVSSTTNKVSYSGNGSTTVFAYTFKIFADGDLDVYIRSSTGTETLQTLTTNYTVSNAGVEGGGNVTFVTAPATGETVVIQRKLALTQGTDYVENDPFPAESHEEALDRLTFVTQQMQEEIDRSIKASVTNTITSTEFTVSAADRASKVFAFDSSGDLAVTQELGTFQGDWAASTSYAERDLVKDTSTNNIFLCNTAHTSSGSQPLTSNTDSAKWDLIVDAAAATTSATNAASSATAAASSATAAAASATAAAASEAGVAADAAAASASASAAATSATNASNSETAAAASETAAGASETAAAASETAAAASESAAATSASNAATSESNAATSASTAQTQASNAATSASNAATSESNASTSATNASTSATAAASSATAAAASEVNAAASAASAAAQYDSFDDRYLGAKTADPALDNDGNALVVGALYFNTTDGTMKVYTSSGWVAASSAQIATMNKFKFTATAAQTAFTGLDDDSNTLSINVGAEIVTLNGVVLEQGTDYTATSSTITLTTGAALNDELNVFAFANFQVADTVSASAGGTFAADIDVTGTITANGLTVSGTEGTPVDIYRNSTSPVYIKMRNDDGSAFIGAEDYLSFWSGGAADGTGSTERMRIDSTGKVGIGTSSPTNGNLVIESNNPNIRFDDTDTTNNGEITLDNSTIRIEADPDNSTANSAISFQVDGSEYARIDSSGNVGIGTSSPSYQVTIETAGGSGGTASSAADNLVIDGGGLGNHGISILAGSGYNSSIYMGDESSSIQGYVQYNHPSDYMRFATNGQERMRIGSTGNVSINSTDTSSHQLLVTDASNRAQGSAQLRIQGSGYSGWHHLDGTAYYIGQNSNSRRLRIYSGNNPAVGVNLAAGATSWGTYSDERLKTDIEPIQDGLAKLENLRCVSYRLNTDEPDSQKKLGLIAQDLVGVIDEVIDQGAVYGEDETEYMTVRYTEVIPVLVKAIQEAKNRIETLETTQADLVARIEALEAN